jgi:hypothetical protein
VEAALRIKFADEDTAYRLLHVFPPLELPWVERSSSKRHGPSIPVLISVASVGELDEFPSACRAHPLVMEVARIEEGEFWAAPSNAI